VLPGALVLAFVLPGAPVLALVLAAFSVLTVSVEPQPLAKTARARRQVTEPSCLGIGSQGHGAVVARFPIPPSIHASGRNMAGGYPTPPGASLQEREPAQITSQADSVVEI
jgi:hypothetical protein